MLPTPSTSHVNYDHIYEPAEDSYLLLDTLSSPSECIFLKSRFPHDSSPPLVMEVGTGSGVVVAFVAANATHIFDRPDVLALGTDVNAFACKASAATVQNAIGENRLTAGSFLNVFQADLTTPLKEREVDVLIFNPPYVPTEHLPAHPAPPTRAKLSSTESFDRDSHLLSLSYAGGLDGMETTNRLLDQLPRVLSERGVAYILLCAQNKPDQVASRVRAWPDKWCAEIVANSGKKAGWEKLCILRIWSEG